MATKPEIYRRLGTATRVFNTEIKKEIIRQKAVDTGRMKNISRLVKIKWDEITDEIELEISSTFYFHGVSEDGTKWKEGGVDVRKSSKWQGGKVNRNITEAFRKREKVVDQVEKLLEVIYNYRVNELIKKWQ
jgi:hypothetical protein